MLSTYIEMAPSFAVQRVPESNVFFADLAQGGLEIPCILTFQGDAKHTVKAKKLVKSALATTK